MSPVVDLVVTHRPAPVAKEAKVDVSVLPFSVAAAAVWGAGFLPSGVGVQD